MALLLVIIMISMIFLFRISVCFGLEVETCTEVDVSSRSVQDLTVLRINESRARNASFLEQERTGPDGVRIVRNDILLIKNVRHVEVYVHSKALAEEETLFESKVKLTVTRTR